MLYAVDMINVDTLKAYRDEDAEINSEIFENGGEEIEERPNDSYRKTLEVD